MTQLAKRHRQIDVEPVRVLGRGLRAQRGVHLSLKMVREAIGRTQVQITQDSQIDQADISRLEARENFDDLQVATLQRYIAALGGQLELVACFGDKRISLVGVKPVRVDTASGNKQRADRKPARRRTPTR